jgi:ABC-type multidrug transport system fused ATPase/permease subunit
MSQADTLRSSAKTRAATDTSRRAEWIGHEWRWLWRQVRPYAGYQVGGLCFILLSSALHLMNPLLMKWMIDDILPGRQVSLLGIATLLFFAVSVGGMLLTSAGRMINQLGVMRLVFNLRTRLLNALEALPAAFHSRHPVGDLVQRLEQDVSIVSDLGSDVLPSAIRMMVQTMMTVAMMVYLDWRLASIVVPLLPVFAWLRYHYRAKLRKHSERVREASGQQSSLLHELLAGILQIQLLGAERRLSRRYARLNLRSHRLRWEQRSNELQFSLATMSVTAFGMALIVGYGGWRVMMEGLSAGSLVAFYSYIGQIFSPLTTATELYARLNRGRASITRLLDIELAPDAVTIADAPDAVPLASPPRLVTVKDVQFGYTRDKLALAGVSIEVRAGERLAIVGPSGCGKSSLLKLIPRAYDPERGRVEIDGLDVRALQVRSVRDGISFVPQDPILFQGTLRDNMRHGNPRAMTEDLDRAAWIACLTEVVRELPNGWDTALGPGGSGISGGEKQRVAIARAILQDRPILILDEATSALDAPTEYRLLERVHDWCAKRIVIVVSHRQSASRWADRVVMFERGRVIESGTHHTLARPGTAYYDLWQKDGSLAPKELPAPSVLPRTRRSHRHGR